MGKRHRRCRTDETYGGHSTFGSHGIRSQSDYLPQLGQCSDESGKDCSGHPIFEKATALDPKDAEAYRDWGQALDALGRHTKAEEEWRKATAGEQAK